MPGKQLNKLIVNKKRRKMKEREKGRIEREKE